MPARACWCLRVEDEACDSFLTAYDLFGDIASISDDSEGSAHNDDVMASNVEDEL